MVKDPDPSFFDRADKHIDLANAQLGDAGAGKVSASMMYATARFNVWLSAGDFEAETDLKKERKRIVDYFVKEYRKMLEDNIADYIENFDSYMGSASGGGRDESPDKG